jgi:hypothetical protein
MEARDSGSRIRPLPIDDIDGDAPQHHPIEPRRRIAPLIVIVAGAIAFAVIARGLDIGDSTEVGSSDTTAAPANLSEEPDSTTTTAPPPPPPPTLLQMLPVVGDRLSLVALTTTAKIGQWDSDLAFPSYNSSISQPQSAQYNNDGTLVAIRSGVGDGVFVIDSAMSGPVYIWDVTSGVWHNTNASLFAWTAIDAETAATVVRVADVSGDPSFGVSALLEFSLPGSDHTLQAWGDWGFVTTSGATTYGFDPDGLQTRMIDGMFFDAATDGMLLLADPGEEGATPFLVNLDGSRSELPSLDIGASDFRITADGSWVLATTIQEDGHTSILARTVRSRSTRLTSVDETARIVNLTSGDRLLVLQDIDSNDLLFKDWNSGAEYRVAIEDPIAAVFLPDEFRLGG